MATRGELLTRIMGRPATTTPQVDPKKTAMLMRINGNREIPKTPATPPPTPTTIEKPKGYFEPVAGQVRLRDILRETFSPEAEAGRRGAVKKVGEFAGEALQFTARTGGSTFLTLKQGLEQLGGKKAEPTEITPEGRPFWEEVVTRSIFGDEPVKDWATRIAEGEVKSAEVGRGLQEKAKTQYQPETLLEKTSVGLVSKAGKLLEKGALPISGLGLPFIAALDFTGAGKAGREGVILALRNANKIDDALRILTKIGVPEDLARPAAEKFAQITDLKLIDQGLAKIEELARTTKQVAPAISKAPQPLAQEARKYKSAEEFVKAVKASPDKIPTTPEYQKFLKEKDAFVKRENEIYTEMKAMRDKYAEKTIKDVPASDITKYENLQKELNQTLSKKTLAKVPEGVIKTHIGEKGLESQLTDFYEQAVKTPKVPKTAEPIAGSAEKEMIKLAQGQPVNQTILPVSLETPLNTAKVSSLLDDSTAIKSSQEINTSRLNISDEAKKIIDDEIESIRPKIEEKIGRTLTNQEAQDLANQSSKILERAVGRQQTLEWEAAMLKLRQRLANAAESGQVTREFLDDLLATKTLGADIGRKLQSLSIGADPLATDAKQAILSQILKTTDDTEAILKAAQGVDFNDFKQASEFYRQFIQPSLAEWVDLLRYNSMLSSPLTHAVNIFSNLINSTTRAPLTKLVAGGLDLLSSTVTGKARKQFAGEAGAYISGYLSNFQEAVKRFTGVWKGTRQFTNLDFRQIPLATKGTKAKVEKVLSLPMRLLEGADQFFMALAESGEKAALTLRQSKGVKVPRLAEQATQEARYGLFRQELLPEGQGTLLNAVDVLTGKVQSLRNYPNPIVSMIAKFTIPFIQTPMNIFKQGIEYSPLGFATAIKSANKVEQLSKALIGTGVVAGAATLIASNRMTWAEPRTTAEKNAWRENGMQPYSIKLGDRWYSYQKLPPFISFPFAMVAAVNDAIKNKKLTDTNAELVLSSFAKYAEFLADQSYFKSFGDLFNALSGDEFAVERLIGNYPQQLVPFRAFGGWLARLTDGLQRQIDNKADFIDKQVQLLMLNVPFVSQRLEPRRGPSGQPIEQRDRLIGAVSPVRTIKQTPAEAKQAEQVEELKQLNRLETQKSALVKEEAITLDAELQALSPAEANARYQQTKKDNPPLYEKLKDIISDRKLGLTYTEKQMKQLGVENGERAKYIDAQIMKLPKEERGAYYSELRKKKIISDDVAKQINKLVKSR